MLVFQSIMGNPAAQVIESFDKFYVIIDFVMVSSFFDYERDTVVFQLTLKRGLATLRCNNTCKHQFIITTKCSINVV